MNDVGGKLTRTIHGPCTKWGDIGRAAVVSTSGLGLQRILVSKMLIYPYFHGVAVRMKYLMAKSKFQVVRVYTMDFRAFGRPIIG